MNKFVTEKWLPALRSNRYRKGRCELYNDRCYCALGVAGRVAGISTLELAEGSSDVYEKIKTILRLKELSSIWNVNDSRVQNWGFPQIANYIEAHPELFND